MQPLEVLYRPLMLLSAFPRAERPQVPALAGLGVLLPRIKPILSGFELPNHTLHRANRLPFIHNGPWGELPKKTGDLGINRLHPAIYPLHASFPCSRPV